MGVRDPFGNAHPDPPAGEGRAEATGPIAPPQAVTRTSADPIATSANAPIDRPDTMLTRRSQSGVIRERRAPTTADEHDPPAADPANTPSGEHGGPGRVPARDAQGPTNSAANERIVIGLVRVSPSVDR